MRKEKNLCGIRSDKLALPIVSTGERFGHDHGAGSRLALVEIDGKLVPAEIQTISNDRGSSLGSSFTYFTISRPLREKPWYIEYDDANGIRQKSWFNLNMP